MATPRSSGQLILTGLVVRGAVRLVAAAATRLRGFEAAELCPPELADWRALRRRLATRQVARCAPSRFHKDPDAYLSTLEAQLSQPTLPPWFSCAPTPPVQARTAARNVGRSARIGRDGETSRKLH